MKRSSTRILTSHTGSLARPADLLEMLRAKINGRAYDENAFAERLRTAVADVVEQQVHNRIDIPSDGEQGKAMFADYVADRIGGFEGETTAPGVVRDARYGLRPDPFPAYTAWQRSLQPTTASLMREKRPVCVGPLVWKDRGYETDIANFKAALSTVQVEDAFLPAPSPGIIAMRIPNEHYPTEEAYLFALADVLKDEYKAITDAGLMLQIDGPDAATSWDWQYWESLDEFRRAVEMRTEALNTALQGIPEDRIRFHVCWGNVESPHTNDVALRDVIDIVLRVKASIYSVEAANPRHAHEWQVWEDVRLPAGKAVMPGVIDSLTTIVEHPDLVAQRIVQYANLVGRENVIAGTDCGFATGASANPRVHPEIALAKLHALSDGAARASRQLWSQPSENEAL
jgi:5-methyltetrahydropteroyltriglutamate--homocysteine methyltransferase